MPAGGPIPCSPIPWPTTSGRLSKNPARDHGGLGGGGFDPEGMLRALDGVLTQHAAGRTPA
jgi:hypothetical protein